MLHYNSTWHTYTALLMATALFTTLTDVSQEALLVVLSSYASQTETTVAHKSSAQPVKLSTLYIKVVWLCLSSRLHMASISIITGILSRHLVSIYMQWLRQSWTVHLELISCS